VPFVLLLSAIEVAVTAPLLAFLPWAEAQSPTFAAVLVVLTVVVYVVFAVTVMVPLAVVIVDPLTAVTLPATTSPKPPNPPRWRVPVGAPLGRDPVGAPLGRVPDGRRLPAPNPHVPLDAATMRTVVAVIDFDEPDAADDADEPGPDVDADVATTQVPVLTAASVVFCSIVKRVDDVYVTAVCALVLCTCSVDPETWAISPDAAGPPKPRPCCAPF
jgi:hypothetical protein